MINYLYWLQYCDAVNLFNKIGVKDFANLLDFSVKSNVKFVQLKKIRIIKKMIPLASQ